MKDGYIWGRGTRDDKDHVAANLIVMLLAKRMNVKLDRDIIFLAEAGEESTTEWGIDYMVREHFPEIDAEFSITEGGGGRTSVEKLQQGKPGAPAKQQQGAKSAKESAKPSETVATEQQRPRICKENAGLFEEMVELCSENSRQAGNRDHCKGVGLEPAPRKIGLQDIGRGY